VLPDHLKDQISIEMEELADDEDIISEGKESQHDEL